MWEYSELNFIKKGDVSGEIIWTTITDPQNTAIHDGDYEVVAFGDSIIFSNSYWDGRYSLKIMNDNIELSAILGSHTWVLRGDREE